MESEDKSIVGKIKNIFKKVQNRIMVFFNPQKKLEEPKNNLDEIYNNEAYNSGTINELVANIPEVLENNSIEQENADLDGKALEEDNNNIQIEQMSQSNSFEEITIEENDSNDFTNLKLGNINKTENDSKKIENLDDIVLVHRTEYFPKGGIIKTSDNAGVKGENEYNGQKYEFSVGRNTLHFALNGEVTEVAGGNDWKQMPISIVIPYKALSEEQKKQFIGGLPVDFFCEEDMELPEGSFVICSNKGLEDIEKDAGKAQVIEVPPNLEVGEVSIKGYADELVAKLGYKVEEVGMWSWEDKNDDNTAKKIIEDNFSLLGSHHNSEYKRAEDVRAYVNDTIEVLKLKKAEGKDELSIEGLFKAGFGFHTPSFLGECLVEEKAYQNYLYEKLTEIGLPLSESTKKEFENILTGNGIDENESEQAIQSGCKNKNEIVLFILKKRIIGEVILDKIGQELENEPDNNFSTIKNKIDEKVYSFVGKDRIAEFAQSRGLSEIEANVLKNPDLAKMYEVVNNFKQVPLSELTSEQKRMMDRFVYEYESSYSQDSFRYYYDSEEQITTLEKYNSKEKCTMAFSEDEAKKLEAMSLDPKRDYVIIQKGDPSETLIQHLENFEKARINIEENFFEQNQITTSELGKQTFEEQKDIGAMLDMESLINAKIMEVFKAKTEKNNEGVAK